MEINDLTPRSYRSTAHILRHDLMKLLECDPLSFDCLTFPAKHSEYDLRVSPEAPEIGMMDRDEKLQDYEKPILAKAYIVPEGDDILFGTVDSQMRENFNDYPGQLKILCTNQELRSYSLILWREYENVDSDIILQRLAYVAQIVPLGRTLGAGVVYICHPMPATGEMPEIIDRYSESESDASQDANQDATSVSVTEDKDGEEDFTPVNFTDADIEEAMVGIYGQE